MTFNQKNILVIGLAKSGVSAIKVLHELGAKVTVTDLKPENKLEEIANEIRLYVEEMVLGTHPTFIDKFDMAVISPGVPTQSAFVQQLYTANIPVIGEIELAFQLCKGDFLGITGTNGKTTTTALIGTIFEAAHRPSYVVGNIGIPAISKAIEATSETVMITELSSFQLETISAFRAHIALILNLTPDHLDRHGTMESYRDAKARIFENQLEDDYLVLNYDDEIVNKLGANAKGKVRYFSQMCIENQNAFVKDENIYLNVSGDPEFVCSIEQMQIFGKHNVENALAAALSARLAGIDANTIGKAICAFKGVEHRIEYTEDVCGRKFYNDSKGTNPDSTVCAIRAMKKPTHLIAGGYDKKVDLSPIFDVFEGKIKSLILMGATAIELSDIAISRGFEAVTFVENMEEAVQVAYENSQEGDAILLSPACASWGMYDNYEQRGRHFKTCVSELKSRCEE